MSFHVLSIGNCAYDHQQIQRLFAAFSRVELRAVDSADEAVQQINSDCQLVLINRILDRTGECGLELVQRVKREHPVLPVMLISNFAAAQEAAEQAGALPGFGKAQLDDPDLVRRLEIALSPETAP